MTDSAASSTAFQCGVKTNKGLLGLDPRVARDDCAASLRPDMQLTSILDWSLQEGASERKRGGGRGGEKDVDEDAFHEEEEEDGERGMMKTPTSSSTPLPPIPKLTFCIEPFK